MMTSSVGSSAEKSNRRKTIESRPKLVVSIT